MKKYSEQLTVYLGRSGRMASMLKLKTKNRQYQHQLNYSRIDMANTFSIQITFTVYQCNTTVEGAPQIVASGQLYGTYIAGALK